MLTSSLLFIFLIWLSVSRKLFAQSVPAEQRSELLCGVERLHGCGVMTLLATGSQHSIFQFSKCSQIVLRVAIFTTLAAPTEWTTFSTMQWDTKIKLSVNLFLDGLARTVLQFVRHQNLSLSVASLATRNNETIYRS
jgi:hypothetical protein